jgi:hypothetical protein
MLTPWLDFYLQMLIIIFQSVSRSDFCVTTFLFNLGHTTLVRVTLSQILYLLQIYSHKQNYLHEYQLAVSRYCIKYVFQPDSWRIQRFSTTIAGSD